MRGSAGKMLAPKLDNLIIDPWNPHNKRGELTPYSCPLTSAYMPCGLYAVCPRLAR